MPARTSETNEGRLSRLEASQLALVETVDRYIHAAEVGAKERNAERLIDRAEWREATKNIGKANWPVYLSAVGIVLIMGTAVLAPLFSSVTELTRVINDHKQLPVHPVAAVELKEIYMRLEKLEKQVEAERAVPTPRFP